MNTEAEYGESGTPGIRFSISSIRNDFLNVSFGCLTRASFLLPGAPERAHVDSGHSGSARHQLPVDV